MEAPRSRDDAIFMNAVSLTRRDGPDVVRDGPKSEKKPPTTSCDGHESHQQSEGAAAPPDAEIHSRWSANNASFLSPQSLSGPVSSKLPRATSSATTWEQDMMLRGRALRRRAAPAAGCGLCLKAAPPPSAALYFNVS